MNGAFIPFEAKWMWPRINTLTDVVRVPKGMTEWRTYVGSGYDRVETIMLRLYRIRPNLGVYMGYGEHSNTFVFGGFVTNATS